MPIIDETGNAVNIQLISGTGDKRTLPGGQVKGAYHLAGGPDSKTLWLTEGYATRLTVQHLAGQPVYVALSTNNLPALAAQLRKTNPDALMLIAADRDDNGTGQLKAEEATKHCKGKAALPPEPATGTTYGKHRATSQRWRCLPLSLSHTSQAHLNP